MGLLYSTNKTQPEPKQAVINEPEIEADPMQPLEKDTTTPITPHNIRLYGQRKAPVSMTVGKLDRDLQDYFLSQPMFSCQTQPEYEANGFYKCVDYPSLKQHVYYEGYFHAQTTSSPVPSVNPRNGRKHDKPAAPPAIRAFYASFKGKNRAALQRISDNIRRLDVDILMKDTPKKYTPSASITRTEEQEQRIREQLLKERADDIEKNRGAIVIFADLFDQRDGTKFGELLVADLAVQVHFGQGVHRDHGWHMDNVNSLFHLAVSVHGKRSLYSRVQEDRKMDLNARDLPVHVDHLEQGDVYVSSPYLFSHAVQYPLQPWDERTMAIQARFLLTSEVENVIYRLDEEVREAISSIVCDVIKEGFSYPSLEEVKAMEAIL